MFENLKKLINKKFYATAEAAKKKVNMFFAYDDLTEDETTTLKQLIAAIYATAV